MKTLSGESTNSILWSIVNDTEYNWMTNRLYSKRALEIKAGKYGHRFSWILRYVASIDHRRIVPSVYVTRTEGMTKSLFLRLIKVEK